MTIPKKGGYSGGRPASEMGPPKPLPSETIKPRNSDVNAGHSGDCEATCDECGPLRPGLLLNIADASWLGNMHNVTTGHRWTLTIHPPDFTSDWA